MPFKLSIAFLALILSAAAWTKINTRGLGPCWIGRCTDSAGAG